MTLHEAIRQVLLESGHPMTASAIAERINSGSLYKRKDGVGVPPTQVEARIANYKDEFYLENGKIFLIEYNQDKGVEEQISLKCREIRNHMAHNSWFRDNDLIEVLLYSISSRFEPYIFQRDIKDVIGQKIKGDIHIDIFEEDVERFIQQELVALNNLIEQHSNRALAVKTVCIYFMSVQYLYRELPQVVFTLLQKKIRDQNINSIDIIDDLIPLYLLDFLDYKKKYRINLDSQNERIKELTSLLLKASGLPVLFEASSGLLKSDLGICIPPLGMKPRTNRWDNELEAVHDQYRRLQPNAYQAFIGTTSVLFQKGHKGNVRRFIFNDYRPTGVYTVPFESQFTGVKSLAFIEFDYSKSIDEIFMGDFMGKVDNVDIQSIIENKIVVKGKTVLVSPHEIEEQNYDLSPTRYLSIPVFDAIDPNQTVEISEIVHSKRGRHVNRKALYPEGEIIYITTKDLDKDSEYFRMEDSVLAIDADEVTGNIPRLEKGDVLVTLIGNELKPNIYNLSKESIVDQNIVILRCSENILPEFLVQSLRSELSLQQINALRQQGTGISRISRLNLLKIRIKLPPLAEQHKILFESRESLTKGKENKLDSDEFNFIATLKHTLKQPLAALSEDFNVLRTFLLQKSENGILSKDEIIVEVFDEDDASTLEKHSLMATLSRCQRMINNAHDHLNKAEQLLKIDSLKPKFEITSIKTLLLKLQEDCPGIEVEFKGRDYELNIDKYSFRIMLDNFIENANKHGFKDMKNPRILFRTEIERDKFDMEYVKIEYLNNGEALSEEITTDKFLRKHSKSNKSAGDGYGGHLINRISQMHKAIIEIDSLAAEKEIDYNVCFNIYLPKLN